MPNKKLLFLIVSVFLVSCSNHNNWISRPSDDSLEWINIPHCTLQERLIPAYIKKLSSISFFETDKKLSLLCESIPEIPQGAKAYIARALYMNKHTGGYLVTSNQNSIWVDHSSLSNRDIEITKSAIVVFSKKRPTNIFVSASTAE